MENLEEEKDLEVEESASEEASGGSGGELSEEVEAEGAKDKAQSTPTFSYFIRILCGAYLIYLSYGLFTGEGANRTLVIIAAGLFTLVGVALIIFSIIGLSKH